MPASLLAAKFYITPALPGLVSRQRLLDHLQSVWDSKLILVLAPAGFGKTTLLSDWISRSTRPAAWISIDNKDNDPIRFLTYFISALQSIKPEAGTSVMALIESAGHNKIRLAVEPLLSDLLIDIAEIEAPFVMVLDDFHLITENVVHQAITFIIDHMPRCMHLVISSRSEPPWHLARLRATRQLAELRIGELRFTTEEATKFLNGTMQLNLNNDSISVLEERTEGWIAGLQMAALSMRGRKDIQDFISAFAGSHHFIADFLVEEVLNQQPEDLRDFLLKTSLLERFSASLCDAVTGRTDSYAVLGKLEQNNLFLVPLDDELKWFRYHHLFRDLLRVNLDNFLPNEVPILHQKASIWFAEAGLHEEAITHAFAAKNLELAASLIEQAAQRIDIENKIVTIAQWLEALPEELVLNRPWLCVYMAWGCYWTGQRAQVEYWLSSAEKMVSAAQPREDIQSLPPGRGLSEVAQRHITGHIATIRSHYALTNEDIPGVLEHSQKALDLLPEGDDARTEAAVALGGAYWGLGDVAAAEHTFEIGRMNALKGGNPSLVVPSTCYMGMQQTKQGRLREAMTTYRDALKFATTPGGIELPAAGFANIKIGDLLREWNQLDSAGPYLQRGVQQCRQLGQADVLTDGYVGLARWQMAIGEFHTAQETLQSARQVKERASIDPFVQCWLDDCQLRLWLIQGNLDSAVRWAQMIGLKPDGGLSYHFDLHHINLARLLVAQARQAPTQSFLVDARNLLERLQAAAEKAGWIQEQIKIHLLQAQTCLISDDIKKAMSELYLALRLAEPGGYFRLFIDEGEELRNLMRNFYQDFPPKSPRLVDYLTQLLMMGRDRPSSATSAERIGSNASIAESLTERELDVLRRLASSLTSNEIAEMLFVAPSTVRTHIKSIYSKLSVNRRLDAIQRAKEMGLL